MIEQRVTLRYGAQQIPAIVQAVQGDTGRDVIFELADYEIPAGATANYYIDKPDGNAVYNSAEVISSTEILAHLTEQALAVPGRNNGQVRILADDEVITSFDFVLEVMAFRGILHMQSETEVNIFDEAIQAAVEDAIQEIQDQTPVVTGMQNSIAPTYSSSSTYKVGDYVMYNAQLYRCIIEIGTSEAWNTSHWESVSIADNVFDIEEKTKQNYYGQAYKRNNNSLYFSTDHGVYPQYENNRVELSRDGTNWGFSFADTTELEIFNKGVEYIVLGASGDYVVCLTVNNGNWGKLICFRENNGSFNLITGNLLTNDSFKQGQVIKVINNLNGVFTVIIGEHTYTIDLSEVQIAFGGSTRDIEDYVIGIAVHANSSPVIVRFPPSVYSFTSEEQMNTKGKTYVPTFTSDDIISKYATATIDGNTVSIVPGDQSHWEAAAIKPKRTITLIGTEYAVIALGNNGTLDFAMTICLNQSNCGKIFMFHDGGGVFKNMGTKVINGDYDPTKKISLTQISPHEVLVVYSGERTIIDVADYCQFEMNSNTWNIVWDIIAFGNCISGTRTFTFENYDPSDSLSSRWVNKKWFAFGDSITAMGYYIGTVDSDIGTKSTKYGHGGWSLAELKNVYTEMIGTGTTPDIITIFAGTNDFGHSGTVEAMEDGLQTILEGLYTAFPKVQIVIITPLQRNFDATDVPTETSGLGPNSLGKYLIDYVDAIKETAKNYGTPCLDMYSVGGINMINASEKTSDGLHPNAGYGVVLGHIISSFIDDYAPYN